MARRAMKMSTVREVRHAVTRIANMVLRGELAPDEGRVMIYAAQTILQSIRLDDQQARIDELELKLNELENRE